MVARGNSVLGVTTVCSRVRALRDAELEVRGWRFEAKELEKGMYFGSHLKWRACWASVLKPNKTGGTNG